MVIKVRKRKSRSNFSVKNFLSILISIISTLFLTLVFAPNPTYKECFKSLSDIQKYASMTNENTPMENNDTLKPDFTNYYKSLNPTFSQKIKNKAVWLLSKFKLVQPPTWNVSAFKILLEELGTKREKSGMRGNFAYRIQTQPNSKFVVFGNLQGSFHSLTRDLAKIKELGIIDESLKITNPQNYIIFIGDVIDRSAFCLETLTIVMRLLEINPNNVIYLRGNHESNNYWQEHTLKTELQIRAAHLSKESIPLEKEINLFFNSLAQGVYLTVPNSQNDFVRISDAGRSTDSTILNESNYSDILIKNTDSALTYFAIKENGETSTSKINIKVIIRGEKKRKTFQKNEGLRLLSPDLDSIAWNILSCPNIVYQKALEFYYDAFALITAAEKINDWEITLCSRDLRTQNPFKEIRYNLISGLDIEAHKKMTSMQIQQPAAQTTPPVQHIAEQVQVQPTQQTTSTTTQTPNQQTQPDPDQQPAKHIQQNLQVATGISQESQAAPAQQVTTQPQNTAQQQLMQEIPDVDTKAENEDE